MLEQDFTKESKILFEHSLAIGGNTYLVIYGVHINGGFICIPNYKIGCEAASLTMQEEFNKEKMIEAGLKEEPAAAIARYIEEWLTKNEEAMQQVRAEANNRMIERLKSIK